MHPLDDAWAKLKHAKHYVNQIHARLPNASQEGTYAIPTRREYKADIGAILWIAASVPELDNDLPLLVGDTLHNLRSSLDLAWWQCAVKHLGRSPTEEEAGSVQFPIRRPGKETNLGSNAHWVGQTAATLAEAVQPDKGWNSTVPPSPPDFIPPPFGALRHLSNIDKHRVLNITYLMVHGLIVSAPDPEQFRDCTVDNTRTADGSGLMQLPDAGQRPKKGSEMLRFYVFPTGPNPDVDLDPNATVTIVVEPTWRLLPLLNAIAVEITALLSSFDPLL